MCAKVLHPCLRLIRVKIVDLELGGLQPNEVIEVERDFIYNKLKVKSLD